MQLIHRITTLCAVILIPSLLTYCSGGGSMSSAEIIGNENGSQPINETEANDYKRAVVRCYKTGGPRVVKIMGQLRCY